ncbi:His-Xaa-Ser system radical SAM maturase HxsC, partial [Pseudoalteromonas sp. Isolate6]|uniref:His-Xaa-Ser system radical SAM maturase HxsC n=1 Tax=Pseudoalteromonas sp. Isolate6 TaxID=2908527 RepID=UPI001EFCD9D1
MNKVMRIDNYFNESLAGIFGPAQIVKAGEKPLTTSFLPTIEVTSNQNNNSEHEISICSSEIDRHTEHGDILLLDGKGNARVILSRTANSNTVLVTEQCDNQCLFCSQPPRKIDDSILYAFAAQAIIAFNSNDYIGITGGEPLLNKHLSLNLLKTLNHADCQSPLHILTNGRAFKDIEFTKKFKKLIEHRNVILGIPLYGTDSTTHDNLVNEHGAWEETIDGLINAGNSGLAIELRIIPTKMNIEQLPSIAEMALNTLNNIVSISIMNLEQEGWAKKNWSYVYLPPQDYSEILIQTLALENTYRVPINLFNYPLCQIPEPARNHACKSISDWKATYDEECSSCLLRPDCGGFFISQKNRWTNPELRII